MAITNRNLKVGTKLIGRYKKAVHTVEVTKDGFRLVGANPPQEFTSISGAGKAIRGGKSTNGWAFFSLATETAPASKGRCQAEVEEGRGEEVHCEEADREEDSPGEEGRGEEAHCEEARPGEDRQGHGGGGMNQRDVWTGIWNLRQCAELLLDLPAPDSEAEAWPRDQELEDAVVATVTPAEWAGYVKAFVREVWLETDDTHVSVQGVIPAPSFADSCPRS